MSFAGGGAETQSKRKPPLTDTPRVHAGVNLESDIGPYELAMRHVTDRMCSRTLSGNDRGTGEGHVDSDYGENVFTVC